jgi:hypothetical protein
MPVAVPPAPRLMPSLPQRLPENRGLAFRGDDKRGLFELSAAAARRLLAAPNLHGKRNSDVVRRWAGAADLRRAPLHRWIIDFPPELDEREAALYERPYARIRRRVRPAWSRRRYAWWIHGGPQLEMRIALAKRDRFIATPAAGRPPVFVWLDPDILPDRSLIVFGRDDDWCFGVLHSRLHHVWALRVGPQFREKESGFRSTPAACFETFPFPWPPATPLGKLTRSQEDHRTTIGEIARALDLQRREWLGDYSGSGRTFTALYNARPAWLAEAHALLDEAVAAAYGWPADLTDDELFRRLLTLNRARAAGS